MVAPGNDFTDDLVLVLRLILHPSICLTIESPKIKTCFLLSSSSVADLDPELELEFLDGLLLEFKSEGAQSCLRVV